MDENQIKKPKSTKINDNERKFVKLNENRCTIRSGCSHSELETSAPRSFHVLRGVYMLVYIVTVTARTVSLNSL